MKVVVITGASSGIGAACAVEFARHGNALVLGARREEKLVDVARRCQELGASRVTTLPLDVCDPDSVQRFVEATLAQHGHVDVLVNNAGLALGADHVVKGSEDDWQRMLDTNVMGIVRVTKAFLPSMIARDRGDIVNMGSVAGFQTYAGGSVYAGSKHAVRAISGALTLELNGTMIRVSEIDPGMVETEFSLVRFKQNPDAAKAVYKGMQPLTGQDVAEIVHFVTSRPPHVNLDHVIVMPTHQASVYKTHRES